jgi:hypothetical protein
MMSEREYSATRKGDGAKFTFLQLRIDAKLNKDPTDVSMHDRDFRTWLTKIALLRKWVIKSAYSLNKPKPPCYICSCSTNEHREECMYTRCKVAFQEERGVNIWTRDIKFIPLPTGNDYELVFTKRNNTPKRLEESVYMSFHLLAQFCLDIEDLWGDCGLSGEMSIDQLAENLDLSCIVGTGRISEFTAYRVPLIFYKGIFMLNQSMKGRISS